MFILHPAIIHLPIGLLVLYGLLELARWRRFIRLSFWAPMKAVLVVFGSLGAWAAVLSGELWADLLGENELLEIHEFFGYATAIVFSLLALAYLIHFKKIPFVSNSRASGRRLEKTAEFVLETPMIVFLTLIGLIFLVITGALGGGMAHGSETDPLTRFIFGIFG